MSNQNIRFTPEERILARNLVATLRQNLGNSLRADDERTLWQLFKEQMRAGQLQRDVFGLNPVVSALQTAQLAFEETGLRRDGIVAIILSKGLQLDKGMEVDAILHGLARIRELNVKTPVMESENFRNLLLSFAEDMRVILIMIAERVNLMRQIRDTDNEEAKQRISEEAAFLYAPLAHKLGLYKLKSELEDLSLKYREHDAYYMIREKLSATKQSRDAYIERFIEPVEQRLAEAGLTFHMKGRTKSIHSIWQKMKKQNCGFEGIYDLFAIRIIIDAPVEKEKMQCWQAFSIVTDMYQPNPKRLRDWLSVPKSNGYESLHITVLGPEQKWVEVQIRTERMDEIAERGLAAHWRYKGVKADGGGMDEWLNGIRQMLEDTSGIEAMDQFKMDLYDDEIYV
ncbi:MAG: bifunctional (p)ppGpp synthetase/guanosine-3',5'-bis(diphosphate) 3'-pyrophosphohydrolase, partial [Prevotella sp.]|nr:bifunctional (p)ppGpp synthetase/guanosine-3',5'-bis(diphosphate) 3'-pyrophosphohydrolase [Prevotella sp.]